LASLRPLSLGRPSPAAKALTSSACSLD
jgi:hypothetical protein